MFDFEALSQAIPRQTVLCVGDLMLDEFVYGEVSRDFAGSAGARHRGPAQRDQCRRRRQCRAQHRLARRALHLCRPGRRGRGGREAEGRSGAGELIEAVLVSDPSRPTTRKVRFVSEHFSTHMLRADWELAVPASAEIEQKLIDAILPQLARADIVLLSDYAKGVLTARVIRNIIDAAKKLGKRVIVDPKSANFAIYRGATLLTPNRKEFAEATRSRADTDLNIAARGAGRDGSRRLRGHAGDAERTRHDAGGSRRRGDPRAGVAGQGARRLWRGRHGRRRAGADAGGRGRLGDGAADGECGGRGRGRQEGHRDRDAGGAAAENPAACVAGGRREDRACRRRSRCASRRLAPAGAAHRLHQWLLRHSCIPATSRC